VEAFEHRLAQRIPPAGPFGDGVVDERPRERRGAFAAGMRTCTAVWAGAKSGVAPNTRSNSASAPALAARPRSIAATSAAASLFRAKRKAKTVFSRHRLASRQRWVCIKLTAGVLL